MTSLPFELFLGLRYLRPKRTFVSVITLISLAGVTIGVWVLIVVIAVMSGFDRELRDKLLGMHPHVSISGGLINNPNELIATCLQNPQIKGAAPFVMGLVLVEYDRRVSTPFLRGIDPTNEITKSKLGSYIKDGSLDLDGEKVLIGRELAAQYGIYLGDKITVYSPRNLQSGQDEVYLPLDLTVTGIFQSGMYEHDAGIVFTSLETAQELYGLGSAVHGIELMTSDPIHAAHAVATELNKQLPSPLYAQTWAQMNQRLLNAIQVEKSVMFFILTFIIVVAAFGITSTLITVTVQKTKEIGIIKALGASSKKILSIFLLQGLIVGALGVAMGVGLGLVTIENINPINRFLSSVVGIDLFPKDIYNFSEIPAYLTVSDLTVIGISALVICTIAGLLPALRAARMEPAEALRHE